jgi:hypothetical protein
MLLEVARYLGAGAEHLADPAFSAYHAVLELSCADSMLEPGNTMVEAVAKPVAILSHPLLQVPPSQLPAYTPPPG